MAVQYFTDSSCDLPFSYYEAHDVHMIPLSYSQSGEEHFDAANDQLAPEFYRRLRAGEMSTTSQITLATYDERFREALSAGDDVVYIAFGSALSGSCHSAQAAAKALVKEFPERTIHVVDTRCASMGQGLLLHKALQLRDGGASPQEVVDWCEANKGSIVHWVTADDLNHLRRGGRVSAASAFLGTMLNIKVIIHVDDEGRLIPVEKVKGRKRALRNLVDHMRESAFEPIAEQTVFVSHADCEEDAQAVVDMIRREMGVTDFLVNHIGPVIGSHTGAGTVALFFMGKPR